MEPDRRRQRGGETERWRGSRPFGGFSAAVSGRVSVGGAWAVLGVRAVGALRARWWRSDTAGTAAATRTRRRTVSALPSQSQHRDFIWITFSFRRWFPPDTGVGHLLFFSVGRGVLFFLLFMSYIRFVLVLFLFFLLFVFLHFFFLFLKVIKQTSAYPKHSRISSKGTFSGPAPVSDFLGQSLQC